jgi:hypothetical protein
MASPSGSILSSSLRSAPEVSQERIREEVIEDIIVPDGGGTF